MPPVPVLTAKQVIAILERHGFVRIRQRESHVRLRHSDRRVTTVAVHSGRTIPKGLLRLIIRQSGHDVTDFRKS